MSDLLAKVKLIGDKPAPRVESGAVVPAPPTIPVAQPKA
jgi:hypothetical protein